MKRGRPNTLSADYSGPNLTQILHGLDFLDFEQLGQVLARTQSLYGHKAVGCLTLPPECWKLILAQTISNPTISSAFGLYEGLVTLFRLSSVSHQWSEMVALVRTSLLQKNCKNIPLMKKTMFYSNVFGHLPIFLLLFETWKLKAFNFGVLPLQLAMCFSNRVMTRAMLQMEDFSPYEERNTAIRIASEVGDFEMVRHLISDLNVSPEDVDNYSIVAACQAGATEVVALLLAEGVVDASVDSNYPIQLAAENGNTEVVKLLLADDRVNPGDEDDQALRWAVISGHTDVVKVLLADPRVNPTREDYTFWSSAILHGHEAIVKAMLEDGRVPADLSRGLSLAARTGACGIVATLLQHPTIQPNAQGNEAIQMAAMCGRLDVLKLLLERKEVREDESNVYLLINSIDSNRLDLVRYVSLLPFSDVSLHSSYAIQKAIRNGYDDIADYLMQFSVFEGFGTSTTTLEDNEVLVTYDLIPGANRKGDCFAVDSGGFGAVCPSTVAQQWCSLLGFKRPLRWETRTLGHCMVYCVPQSCSNLALASYCPWSCIEAHGPDPVIFSLVCEVR